MSGMFDNDDTNTQREIDPETAFAELVGEGKKYKTPQELAKAYFHLEVHTGTIEQENASLRDHAGKAATIEELLSELRGTTPDRQGEPKTHDSAGTQDVDVQELVRKELEAYKSKDKEESNKSMVRQAFIDTFGTSAGAVFNEMQKDLGEDLEALAARSPNLVIQLIKKQSASAASAPGFFGRSETTSTQRPGSMATRKDIEARAKKEGWSRDRKFKELHAGLDAAIRAGTFDKFNS